MEKVRRKNSRHYIDNMSIKNSFVFYALISLVIGIVIGVISITLVDDYRINLNYKYEDMTTRYDIPENGSFTAKYKKDQTEYTIYNASEKEVCNFVVDYQKERPVQEYIYPNHVSYIEVSPKFTKHDRIVDSALGVVNIVTIPIVLSISMILCVTIFVNRKLVRPIKLLTNAYRKVENNELDFTLPYPYKDEMGRLCLAFEKMKNCLYQNNQKMIRQFTEQRRLNAAFSHDLRTPLTILKGHTTMLLSFIPKGLVSQQEVLDELSTVRNNVERLEKYVSAMTNLYRLEDIEIEKENINFDFLLKTLSNTTEMLCSDIEYTIKTNCNKQQTLFINLEIIIQIYENLLSNSIRYAKSMIAIDVNKQEEFLLITVSDDGCGFKSTDIERVTLPFYKPSQDTTSEHLGLGLNICKILCERHGGTIKISNNHKGGACVTACIKIAYVDEK
jgi:signal transduction histidine kinase